MSTKRTLLALAGTGLLLTTGCVADIDIDADLNTGGVGTTTEGGSTGFGTGGECFNDADCPLGALCQGGICIEVPMCGNGIIDQFWEQCDDGNQLYGDGCDAMCQVEQQNVCGNGLLEPFEECDDGNLTNGDGCDGMCFLEPDQICGDGIVGPGEQCDDGNGSNTDACPNTCELAACGDGWVYAGIEECDDGNTTNLDGCSDTCRVEALPVVCGDGIQAGGELCLEVAGLVSGNAPTEVGLADMNQDGALDVVAAWYGDSRIQVFRNAGDGKVFFPDPPTSLSGLPMDLDLADMNGDGLTDVVVATSTARVEIYRQSGGTLVLQHFVGTNPSPTDMGVGDVDSDGIPDIVVPNSGGTLQVLRGLGSWSFSIQPSTPLGGWVSRDMELADVNLDGYADALFLTSTNELAVFTGATGASLLASSQTPALGGADALAVADADQDGWLDAFSTEAGSDRVGFYPNAGGVFDPPHTSNTGAPNISDLGLADLDGDGWPDLVVSVSGALRLLAGDGSGAFNPYGATMSGSPASDLAFGDLDGDGRTDVAAALTGSNAVRIFLNRP